MIRRCLLISLLICVGLILKSCTSYTALYNVGLSKVEAPTDIKEKYGETKVTKFTDSKDNTIKYQYKDDYIDIVWYVGIKQFNFSLTNISQHPIKINWDEITYVDQNSNVKRTMHAGVKYTERNNSQPSSTIPKGAKINDLLLPTDNVYFVSGQYGGWKETALFPVYYSSKQDLQTKAPLLVGTNVRILFPISIEGVTNDYTFEFEIMDLLNK